LMLVFGKQFVNKRKFSSFLVWMWANRKKENQNDTEMLKCVFYFNYWFCENWIFKYMSN
jgi:hypothetical protein